nr:DUF2142 domain-containing protein [Flaviflexus huanghaiensis]
MTLLTVIIQVVWALTMPAFRGPDEPHHVNSIMRLASGGGWPEPGGAMIDPVISEAGRQAGLIQSHEVPFTGEYRTRLLHGSSFGGPFADTPVTPHRLRDTVYPVEAHHPSSIEVDQMTQHPPLYYAGGALVVKAFGLEDAPWDRLVHVLRVYGIALTIPLVPATIYTARRLGANRHWSLAAGLIPLAIPQVFGITAVVTNDTLAIGAGALVVAALAKAGTERISPKTVALVGGSLGFALWSKGLLLAFGLPLILVFLLADGERWRTRLIAALVSGSMALLIGWWWLLNIVRYGVLQPAGYSRPVPADWDPATAEVSHFVTIAFRTFTKSFFSSYGWLEADFPTWLTWILLGLLLGGTALSIAVAGRSRKVVLILLSPFAGLIVLLYVQGWFNYVATSVVAGVQGRYLYPTLAAFGCLVLGIAIWGRWGYRLFALLTVGVGAFGYAWLLRNAYPGQRWFDIDRFAHVAGVPAPIVVIILTLYLLVNVTILVVILRKASDPDVLAGPQSGIARRRWQGPPPGSAADHTHVPAGEEARQ